jgi:AraC-like DNA-binding protein
MRPAFRNAHRPLPRRRRIPELPTRGPRRYPVAAARREGFHDNRRQNPPPRRPRWLAAQETRRFHRSAPRRGYPGAASRRDRPAQPLHFARAFKHSFGVPPHRYHLNRRIERAKSLLRERARSVTEVGLMLGFCDTSAFTTSFRRAMGMTPSDYRQLRRCVGPTPTIGSAST